MRRPEVWDHARPYRTPDWETDGQYNLCPRDVFLTLDNWLIEAPMALRCRQHETLSFKPLLLDYMRRGARWAAAPRPRLNDEVYCLDNHNTLVLTNSEPAFDAANILRLGRDVLYLVSNTGNAIGAMWLQSMLASDFRVRTCAGVYNGSHIDTTMAPIRPGLVVVSGERVRPELLPEIGDPLGVNYVVETLDLVEGKLHEWGEVCHALTFFEMSAVQDTLLAALESDEFVMTERDPRQRREPRESGIGCRKPARDYFKRARAANALSGVTGANWGPVFNEDLNTWKAWRAAGSPESFDPQSLSRTPEEVSRLVETLLDRFMSGRTLPVPGKKHDYTTVDFASPAAVRRIAADLGSLGSSAPVQFASVAIEHVRSAPAWKSDLGDWVKRVLLEVRLPEAASAVSGVENALAEMDAAQP